MVYGAVIKRVYFILTQQTYRRLIKKIFSERKLEESGFNKSTVDDWIDERTKSGPPKLRLHRTGGAFRDRILTTKKKYLWAIGALSVAMAGYATKRLIYSDLGYALVTEVLALVLFFVLVFCFSMVVPPKLKRVQGRAFDRGVSLFGTDGATGRKKEPRK
jgi:hypothetical protein